MSEVQSAESLFSGWQQACLIVASFVVQVVVMGLFYSYGTIFAALKADTGDAASTLALMGSIRDFVFQLSTAPAGFLVHRVGFVRMAAIGTALLLFGMLADSYAPSSHFLFMNCGLVGGAMAMIFTASVTVLYGQGHITPSFLPVAVGLASSGGGLGTVVVNLGLDLLLESFSWRGALRICCGAFGLLLFVSLVALWCSLRHHKQNKEVTSESRELRSCSDVREFLQPFGDLQFLLLNAALFLYGICFMVPYTHLVYYAETERGLEISGELTSLLGISGAAARLCFGLFSTCVKPSRLFLLVLLAQGTSLICLPFCDGATELRAFSAIYGFSSGGRVVLLSLVVNELFDSQRVAHLYGLAGIPIAVGSLLGPPFVGKVYDLSGHYEGAFFAAGCKPFADIMPEIQNAGSVLSGLQQACLVVASFLVQVVVLGLFYSYGTLFAALKADTGDAASTLALVGSIRDFLSHLCTAPAGFVVQRVGFVRMASIGAVLLLFGMLADSYAPSSYFLFITCSLVGGVAMAILFTAVLAALYGPGHISPSFLPVAVGLASSGGGLGTVVVNLGLNLLLDSFSWREALRICSGAFGLLLFVSLVALWCSLRHHKQTKEVTSESRELRSYSDVREFLQPFGDLQFLLLNAALFLYGIGFMVPYTHLVYYAETERGLEISGDILNLSALLRRCRRTVGVFCHLWIAVGTLLGPTFVGKVYDLSGHYDGAFFAAGGIVLVAVPVFCLAIFCRRSIEKPSSVTEVPAKADHLEQIVPPCDPSDEFPDVKNDVSDTMCQLLGERLEEWTFQTCVRDTISGQKTIELSEAAQIYQVLEDPLGEHGPHPEEVKADRMRFPAQESAQVCEKRLEVFRLWGCGCKPFADIMPEIQNAGSVLSGLQQACLVVASFLVQVVVLGLFYSYGTLFAALKADTGDAASTLALVGSIRDFVFASGAAPAGFLVQRVGFVRMPAIGSALLLLSMLADSYAPSSYFLFITCSLAGGVAMAMIFTPALTVLYGPGHISRSFLPVAVGLASSGGGLGTVVVNLGLDLLLESFSWRGALRICCGAFGLLLLASVVALWYGLRRHKKSGDSTTDYQELRSGTHVRDFFQPFGEFQFLLLNASLFLYCIGFMVPYTHLVYYAANERGLDISGELTSLLGGAGAAARLCFGLFSAFVRPSRLFLVVLLVTGASLICLPFCDDASELKAFSAIYGFSSGGRVVLLSLLLNELFDAQRVAHLYGLAGIPIAVGTLLGPTFVGKVYDLTGHYDGAFFAAGGIVLLAVPVFCLAAMKDSEKADHRDQVVPACDASEESPQERKENLMKYLLSTFKVCYAARRSESYGDPHRFPYWSMKVTALTAADFSGVLSEEVTSVNYSSELERLAWHPEVAARDASVAYQVGAGRSRWLQAEDEIALPWSQLMPLVDQLQESFSILPADNVVFIGLGTARQYGDVKHPACTVRTRHRFEG
ncbi:slc16a12 [Symbiodinium sp. KB8]|nr:slc16a12 [Symbiodinium sp. KB8]